MEIRPVGAELFHTDGRAAKTKLTVAFRNLTNGSKSTQYMCQCTSVKNTLYEESRPPPQKENSNLIQ